MKQIALGLDLYCDAHGDFPCGTVSQPSLCPDERLSWLVSLLPFLEQQNLYSRFDQGSGWAAEKNEIPSHAPMRLFNCNAQPVYGTLECLARSSYVGIAGIGSDAACLPLEDKRCGVFGYERHIKMKDAKDGMSNTLAIIETLSENGRWAAGGRSTVRAVDPAQQPYVGENRPFGIDHRTPLLGSFEFASATVLANAALLDGSVRTLTSSINPQTLEALATIAGKEPIPGDF